MTTEPTITAHEAAQIETAIGSRPSILYLPVSSTNPQGIAYLDSKWSSTFSNRKRGHHAAHLLGNARLRASLHSGLKRGDSCPQRHVPARSTGWTYSSADGLLRVRLSQ